MCGIVGRYHFNGQKAVDRELLVRMRDSMVHRGPDGAGIWIARERTIGLAHRRLAIIDLAPEANQPMLNDDGSIVLVFNGEIYNHAEIRKELEGRGRRFKTDHSDTEVIVRAYEEWGIDCLHRFRGMFAFGLWDEKVQTLWLVRDRVGIKPLYYTVQNGVLSFASEIKALLEDPAIPRRVDEKAFYHYLSFLVTPAPSTMFVGISKLPPGSLLEVRADGSMISRRWWDPWDFTKPLVGNTDDEIAEQLLSILRESVRLRKVSDVPVGVFLSGGVDSSTNAALFSEGTESGVKTFSIGYGGDFPEYPNELPYARMVAKALGTEHHEYIISERDALEFIPKMVWHQDEPIADPVCIPVYFVSRLARQHGTIVCQLGEGSDELFWGYEAWKTSTSLQTLNDRFPFTFAKRMGLKILEAWGKERTAYYEWLRRGAAGEPVFWGGAEAFTGMRKNMLLSPRLRQRFDGLSSWEVLAPIRKEFEARAWEKTPLHWMSYLDLRMRLPELLLMRVDKMSMAVALEARVPFLDHKFVEFALSVPSVVKMRGGVNKALLKRAVRGLIPDAIIDRKKVGFGAPIHSWFLDTLGTVMRKSLLAFCDRTDFFNREYLNHLFETKQSMYLWFLYNFVLWHEHWIEQRS